MNELRRKILDGFISDQINCDLGYMDSGFKVDYIEDSLSRVLDSILKSCQEYYNK